MEKIREKNTAWLETIRSFLAPEENIEDEKNSGYEEWKRANADIIDQKAIANLEKMMERQVKKNGKPKIQSKDGNSTRTAQQPNNKEVKNQGRQQRGLER